MSKNKEIKSNFLENLNMKYTRNECTLPVKHTSKKLTPAVCCPSVL